MTDLGLKWQTILTDVSTLSTGGIVLLTFFLGVTPLRRGFFCDDESIRYSFKESTIPNWALYIYTITIPFLVIAFTEFISHRRSRGAGTILSRPAPLWLIHLYRSFVDFLFGCVASQLVTDVGKYTIGRLRPNFIAVCKPNVTLGHCQMYNNDYIQNYICENGHQDAKESRVSFPSGHSSFSAYTMLYVAIFIQLRWNVSSKNNFWRLIKCATQICLILIAYYTALSRVMDNKHHWSDVAAGSLIGAITASLTTRYVSNLMSYYQRPYEDKYSINADGAPTARRSPANLNYDLEAQPIPKNQISGEQN